MTGDLDRRVRRTLAAITEAYCDLVEERPGRNITVAALASKADIHRRTFYLHYRGVSDLKASLEDGLIADFNHLLLTYRPVPNAPSSSYFLESLVEYIAINLPLCRTLFSDGQTSLIDKLFALVHNYGSQLIGSSSSTPDARRRQRYILTFYCAGMVGIWRDWFSAPTDYSVDQMVLLVGELAADMPD